MAMKEQYYTVDGQMIGYKTVSGRKDFLTDALGSVTAEVDQTGASKTFDGRYKPYGGVLSALGAGGSFGWAGSLGYRATNLTGSNHYVRARHFNTVSGQWSSKDPIWPRDQAYRYSGNRPVIYVDPTGLLLINVNSFISRDMQPYYSIKLCDGSWSHKWIATPPNLNDIEFVRGDDRTFFEQGTARIRALASINSCSIGKLTNVNVNIQSNTTFGAELGGRSPFCWIIDTAEPKPTGGTQIIWQNATERFGTTKFYLWYQAADPLILFAPPITLSVQFTLTVDYCLGAGGVNAESLHTAFPWHEASLKNSRGSRSVSKIFTFTPPWKSFLALFGNARSSGGAGFSGPKCKKCDKCK